MKIKLRPAYFALFFGIIALVFAAEGIFCKHLQYDFAFVGYGGTFKYHDLKILGIPIYWFMLLCGFAITFPMSILRCEKYGFIKLKGVVYPVILLVITYIGAKLLYIIEQSIAGQTVKLELSGVSMFGACYAVLLLTPVIAKITKENVWKLYDFYSPLSVMLLTATRSGCFFNGCCGAITIWKDSTPIILPVQLMEVVCDLLILEQCFSIERKYPYGGFAYPVCMFSYSICRFLLEFLRNTPKNIIFISNGQLFSIIAVIFSIILLQINKKINPIQQNHSRKQKR